MPVAFEAVRGQHRSVYREFRAPAAAAGLLACTWMGHSGWARSMRVVPDGCCDITFDGLSLWITAPAARAFQVPLAHTQTTVGIRLRPEHTRSIAGDSRALGVGPVDLAAVWDGGSRLARRLADLDNPQARITALAAAIAQRHRPGRHDELLRHARIGLQRGQSVPAVAASVGLSERHLRREFIDAVGIGPKQFSRVARFQLALNLIRRHPGERFADIAAASGFVDEAHLARECGAIAGGTLTSVRRRIDPAYGQTAGAGGFPQSGSSY